MAKFINSLVLFLVALLLLGFAEKVQPGDLAGTKELWELYRQWRTEFNISRTAAEIATRFATFVENVKFIDDFNKLNASFTVKLNAFGDLTNQEFLTTFAGGKSSLNETLDGANNFTYRDGDATPSSIDWRAKKAVSPVRDQGPCGSCWAHAAIATVESLHAIQTKRVLDLSEQALVDCDNSSLGCSGGYKDLALKFIVQNGGIPTERHYRYVAEQKTCDKRKLGYKDVKIRGYSLVTPNDQRALMQAVAKRPVAVSIDASGTAFQFYSSGVFAGPCGGSPTTNHAVTVVGYGAQRKLKYWIVKNSWGTKWGDKGYIKMQKDVETPSGLCLIALKPVFPW